MAPTNLASPYASRPGSACSNDRWSIASPAPFNVPNYTPNPLPAYVATAAASQMVADHHLNQNPDYEQAGPDDDDEDEQQETARFSEEALALLNNFLDQTLYSILATSKSGKLAKLRPAITDVLKPRLAREAIASADEELRELLDGEDEDEEPEEDESRPATAINGAENEGVADLRNGNGTGHGDSNFNLALTWKRTRLRIMVYTRLGDLEDEDEDRYLVDDEDFHHAKHQEAERAKWRGDNDSETIADLGLVSPAAAIFLTSVIEYLAEQTIVVAGQASASRSRKAKPAVNGSTQGPKLIVLDVDMEKVALNPTLGRLWRTWRKRSRGTNTPGSPTSPSRRGNFGSLGSLGGPHSVAGESSAWSEAGGSRRPSMAVADAEPFKNDEVPDTKEHSELELASNIALPLPEGGHARDAEEIEVPGLAREIRDVTPEAASTEAPTKRRASLSVKPEPKTLLHERPQLTRLRSGSAHALPPSRSWVEYLLGRSQGQEEAVSKDDETDTATPTSATQEHETSEEKVESTGIIAGAAAAVGAVVSAVVGHRDGDETHETEVAPADATGETAEAMAKQRSTSQLFDDGEGPELPAEGIEEQRPEEAVAQQVQAPQIEEPIKPESEQQRALRAAETHVKRLSQASLLLQQKQQAPERTMPGTFRDSSDAETLRASDDHHANAVEDEDDMTRPKYLSALPAPLSFAKTSSPTDEQRPHLAAGEPGPTIVAPAEDVSPVSAVSPVEDFPASKAEGEGAVTPPSPQVTESKGLDMTSVAGPAALAIGAGVAGAALTSDSREAAPVMSSANRSAVPSISGPQAPYVQSASSAPQVVDDDYDPFSSVAYPPTNRYSRLEEDPTAIGVARSSDHAIPAPRTPSPQSVSTTAQQQQMGIQGQLENYSQQRQLGPQGAVRNVSGSPPQQLLSTFVPPGGRDSNNARPQSAHRGDSALSGHRDVNAFATAPTPIEPPQQSVDAPFSSQGVQDQQGAQQQQAQGQSTLQAVGNASEHVPERSSSRPKVPSPVGSSTQSTAETRSKGLPVNQAQPQPPSQQVQNNGLSAAAVASAAARPSSSTSARRGTNGSHDGSGLMPRPVDPSRASSESKKRDFEDLLKNGDNETMKYTLTPVRVTDEASANTTTTLKASPVGPERPSSSVTPATTSSSTLRESQPQRASSKNRAPSASASARHTPRESATYRTIPTPTHSRKNTQTRIPGPQPAGSSVGGASTPSRQFDSASVAPSDTTAGASATKKKSQFIAREPRIKQESMRDFADFIRTTGPDKEMNVVPLIPRSGSRQAGSVPSALLASNFHVGRAKYNSGGSGFDSAPGSKRVSTMQARDPAVKRDSNRDLVSFLREGPPGENGAASQPTRGMASPNPMLVAPFSNNGSSSRLASAPGSSAGAPAVRAAPQQSLEPEGGMPKRTRRRQKDPYAIDLDDEDDDLLTALPGAGGRPQRQEESLIDFLRNSEPPTGNSPQALAAGVNSGNSTAQANGANGTAVNGSRTNSLSNSSRVARPASGMRDAKAARVESSRTTSDLADFLKNSGPPGSEGPPGGMPSGKAAKMLGGAAPELQRTGSKGSVKSGKFWKRRTTIDA